MFVTAVGTSVPPQRYTQAQCWDALQGSSHFAALEPRARATARHILMSESNGIRARHLALDELKDVLDNDPDTLHERFARHAPRLAAGSAQSALRKAGLRPSDIDAVIISTCTGYLCPGLTSYVCEMMGLRSEIVALDLVGQGCGAALPNLGAADALISAGRCRHVLSICVEVCSAAFYIDNDPGVIVSACLFGDGAGAAVLSAQSIPGVRRVEWAGAWSQLDPSKRDALRFESRRGMLRNILTPEVPALAGGQAAAVLGRALREKGMAQSAISAWVLHAGGTTVLEEVRKAIGLCESDLSRSAGVLSEYGNLSSPFVYFVLERALREEQREGLWWMSSFGAGFSCHGALLSVSN